ncbi:hypothetical protein Fraau_1446 [Frateuria aurantia DSM 6220]|uniref:Uncharacterized protein n=1 Tax=Frateuria aurantia (strain ATCC 33424 / DSM 6220 / KCTC 2777 / LMG 1558 / NBRC 3245 / NCIMB 13370) TaxID=767434 RepID=H8L5X2_FRAAD|nr:hypothetical protein Fraau_1446 [Frateuria aurantia DSM 6220]
MADAIRLKNDRTESIELQMIGGRCWLVCSSTCRPTRSVQVGREEARRLSRMLAQFAETGRVE